MLAAKSQHTDTRTHTDRHTHTTQSGEKNVYQGSVLSSAVCFFFFVMSLWGLLRICKYHSGVGGGEGRL